MRIKTKFEAKRSEAWHSSYNTSFEDIECETCGGSGKLYQKNVSPRYRPISCPACRGEKTTQILVETYNPRKVKTTGYISIEISPNDVAVQYGVSGFISKVSEYRLFKTQKECQESCDEMNKELQEEKEKRKAKHDKRAEIGM
jgi:NAD-dependent SIR2 family protein deacetylase